MTGDIKGFRNQGKYQIFDIKFSMLDNETFWTAGIKNICRWEF